MWDLNKDNIRKLDVDYFKKLYLCEYKPNPCIEVVVDRLSFYYKIVGGINRTDANREAAILNKWLKNFDIQDVRTAKKIVEEMYGD